MERTVPLTLSSGIWRASFGDPTILGWLTVVLYLLAGGACYRAGRRSRPATRQRLFWWVLSVIVVFLGVNKQLDLQSLLTDFAKGLARAQGWYENRRAVQSAFVAGFALAALAFALWMAVLARGGGWAAWTALAGLSSLGLYVVIRAATFNHLTGEDPRLSLGAAFEIAGTLAISFAGYSRWRS